MYYKCIYDHLIHSNIPSLLGATAIVNGVFWATTNIYKCICNAKATDIYTRTILSGLNGERLHQELDQWKAMVMRQDRLKLYLDLAVQYINGPIITLTIATIFQAALQCVVRPADPTNLIHNYSLFTNTGGTMFGNHTAF